MSWIEKHFQNVSSEAPVAQAEAHFESREQDTWQQLCKGLEQDVSDFNQHGGKASLQESGDQSCRVTSAEAKTSLVLTADAEAHVIRYEYEAEGTDTAVPEGGILSLRGGAQGVEIYSADERLSPEDARRLVLEPLLFPQTPTEDLEPAGS